MFKCINFNDDMQMYLLILVFGVVPQLGKLYITTEFGKLTVEPLEICIIQVSHSITSARFSDGGDWGLGSRSLQNLEWMGHEGGSWGLHEILLYPVTGHILTCN